VRRVFSTLILLLVLVSPAALQERLQLPNKEGSVKFLVIGDSGTGGSEQLAVANRIAEVYKVFPFEFALMVGDNLYGGESAADFRRKFEEPYKPLLDAGVKFYAALGNHDNTDEKNYKPFNMGGQRYYTFKPKNGVRVFALDTNYMDQPQLQWLEKELTASGSDWKIVFFHHPLYSSGGTHGSDYQLRAQLEPMFLKHGVDAVFSGHEHFYERIKPQKGIYYFVSGSAGQLRKGNMRPDEETAAYFDQDQSFMLVEIAGDDMFFQVISRTGKTVDSGVIHRQAKG
jgi:predicted phosphodiesterase